MVDGGVGRTVVATVDWTAVVEVGEEVVAAVVEGAGVVAAVGVA